MLNQPQWDNDPEIKRMQLDLYAKQIDLHLQTLVKSHGGNASFFEDCNQSTMMLAMQGD